MCVGFYFSWYKLSVNSSYIVCVDCVLGQRDITDPVHDSVDTGLDDKAKRHTV